MATFNGTAGPDTFVGTPDADQIVGRAGDDIWLVKAAPITSPATKETISSTQATVTIRRMGVPVPTSVPCRRRG